MSGPVRIAICGLALLLATRLHATELYRCIDAAGHVTFTRQGCPTDASAHLQDVISPPPGSTSTAVRAKPKRGDSHFAADPTAELTVVGEQNDGCGNRVTGSARREAIIKRQVRTGMTRRDVESALGKPDTISHSDGKTRYRYAGRGKQRRDKSRTVNFDEFGCVVGKR